MPGKPISFYALIILVVLACACKKSEPTSAQEEDPVVQKGFASGKVLDGQGRSMAGVKIVIENSLVGNASYRTVLTDQNGNYRIKLDEIGLFYTSAETKKTFSNKEFKIRLHPSSNAQFGPEGGENATRNFTWKLGGMAEGSTQGYYGGAIGIHAEFGALGDPENVEFTLIPLGKLIDGSTGETLKLKCGAPMTEYFGKLVGIPIGSYTVTAVHVLNGVIRPLKVKIKDSDDDLATSVIVNFEPETLAGENMAFVNFGFQ